MDPIPSTLIFQLSTLFQNPTFPAQLTSAVQSARHSESRQVDASGVGVAQENSNGQLYLQIEGLLCTSNGVSKQEKGLVLGCIDLSSGKVVPLPLPTLASTPDPNDRGENAPCSSDAHCLYDSADGQSHKRRKIVSGLRLARGTATDPTKSINHDDESLPCKTAGSNKPSMRQVQSDTGFPQRKNPRLEFLLPVLEPTSADKLIAGIWRQLHSPVQLSRLPCIPEPSTDIRTGVSVEVFREINTLCLKYYNQSQSYRALEMIFQAYWIECFEARVAVIRLEKPSLLTTDARMMVLKEACVVLGWKEKDLRNRMAIWRGYKEIKDAGGWVSLIFASTGIYRFCKYRTGFGDGLSTLLRNIRCSLEVAADTLHPGWRDLLQVVKQDTSNVYHGHPHEWVTVLDSAAVPLASTYEHLQLPGGFQYRFVDECVLDAAVFGTEDPRRVPEIDPDMCPVCKERQSDEIEKSQCLCFPALFGGVRNPVPVQLFRTATGKNNGVIARCNFDRGTAIGQFTGLITNGIKGVDVMVGGSRGKTYQIFQGQMGNFTRFINHSCRPNSQFQRFCWRGMERIIVVSRGIAAGNEITVDYSDHYWDQLNKKCLCGEPCCRFYGRKG
ncbi:SET domain protein [Aspergillus sclerotiicarbonarius CBS 121057]|uniref:SET domain protein n=1 Tax=Aspergillus sclerotiicarbonarius (strain CBS 121057 / IBT 28362) TaxID=1448318 RepID=A0A319EHY6_ASPSB|nr:SET domain protein [Aspergillus sclerotiicarbonarius CBS 121057]